MADFESTLCEQPMQAASFVHPAPTTENEETMFSLPGADLTMYAHCRQTIWNAFGRLPRQQQHQLAKEVQASFIETSSEPPTSHPQTSNVLRPSADKLHVFGNLEISPNHDGSLVLVLQLTVPTGAKSPTP